MKSENGYNLSIFFTKRTFYMNFNLVILEIQKIQGILILKESTLPNLSEGKIVEGILNIKEGVTSPPNHIKKVNLMKAAYV
jgi:hypothetical protein